MKSASRAGLTRKYSGLSFEKRLIPIRKYSANTGWLFRIHAAPSVSPALLYCSRNISIALCPSELSVFTTKQVLSTFSIRHSSQYSPRSLGDGTPRFETSFTGPFEGPAKLVSKWVLKEAISINDSIYP